MQASDLLLVVPAFIGGGLLTVYVAARLGQLDNEDRPLDVGPVTATFLLWPLIACIGLLVSLTEVPMWVALKGDKKYQQKKLLKERLKKLMAQEEKNKQEALRLLEEEMGERESPALTIEQKIVQRVIEQGANDFEAAWADAGQADATPVYVRRKQDGGRFLMTRGTIRSLKSNDSFDSFYREEYPATEEVKT